MQKRQTNLTGRKFGSLTAIRFSGEKTRHGKSIWVCNCDCGTIGFKAIGAGLVSGNTKSCGCLQPKAAKAYNTKHGNTSWMGPSTKEYRAWSAMKRRIRHRDGAFYHRYGGRGISYCLSWENFENFLKDMGKCPSASHSLDRINNKGSYCKKNCRWATVKEQSRNKSSTIMFEFKGRTKAARDWDDEMGFRPGLVLQRVKDYGWSIERAITTPVRVTSSS